MAHMKYGAGGHMVYGPTDHIVHCAATVACTPCGTPKAIRRVAISGWTECTGCKSGNRKITGSLNGTYDLVFEGQFGNACQWGLTVTGIVTEYSNAGCTDDPVGIDVHISCTLLVVAGVTTVNSVLAQAVTGSSEELFRYTLGVEISDCDDGFSVSNENTISACSASVVTGYGGTAAGTAI